MSATPNFAFTPRNGVVNIATANTNRDGTGTIGTLFTAGASGSLVTRVETAARGVTTAGVLRLFLHDNVAYHLIEELLVSAITPSATVKVFMDMFVKISPNKPLWLPANYSLRVATHNAESFTVWSTGGDY